MDSPIYILIAFHFLLLLWMYLKEKVYGFRSIYSFSMFIFVFYPLIYNYFLFKYYTPSWYFHVGLFFTTLLMMRVKIDYKQLSDVFTVLLSKVAMAKIFIACLFILAFISIVSINGQLGHNFRFPAIGLYCALGYFLTNTFINRRHYGPYWVLFLLLYGLTLALFVFVLWSGYGRILLLQLVSSSLFFYSLVFKGGRFVKFIFFISVPLMLGIAGAMRSETGSTIRESLITGDGLGSVISASREAEFVIKDVNEEFLSTLDGDSYIASFLFFVPRRFWEEKPIGFGKQLVAWYMPSYMDTGHSLAGTFYGEAYGNYGKYAMLFGPVLFFLISKVFIQRLFKQKKRSNYLVAVMKMNVGVVYLCAIPDFVWGGTQPFMVRATVASVFIYLLFRVFKVFLAGSRK